MPTASARTPGKAILAGEHFVLHGVPAVAVPVFARELTLQAELHPDSGNRLQLPGDLAAHSEAIHELLGGTLCGRITLTVDSTIPQGSGLGSSAALAVALAEALCELAAIHADAPVADIAAVIEDGIHGRASGIDTAVIRLRAPIIFQPGDGDGKPTITRLSVPLAQRLLLVNSGITRRTAEQIQAVATRKQADPAAFDRVADSVREETRRVIEALEDGNAMLLTRAVFQLGGILTDLDLDPDNAPAIRRITDAHTVALKMTGAGGGGFLIGAAESSVSLDRAAEQLIAAGYDAFTFDVRTGE